MCFGKHTFLEVDEELRLLIPRRTKEEREQLKANIAEAGEIRDPVMVWGHIVVDGMGRVEVARELDLPFNIKRLEFRDNNHCKGWMLANQLGRRNLTEQAVRLMRGELYNLQKDEHGGERKSKCQPGILIDDDAKRPKTSGNSSRCQPGILIDDGNTAMRLAASFGTGTRTINRDGKLAEAVAKLEPHVAKAVVNEDVKASRAAVAQLSRKSPAEQKEIVAKVQSGEAKTVQEAMKPKPPGKPDTSPVVDSLKGTVDESLAAVFTFAAEWSKLKSALSTAKGALAKIVASDSACWLDGQECERHIAQARALLSFAMPYTECCKCRRKPEKSCAHCKGRGWLTKANFAACASDADKGWLDSRAKA